MKNNIMNRIASYNALIAEACNHCAEFKYGFYANDATFTLAIIGTGTTLEIIARFDGGYFFDGRYYETADDAVDAAARYIDFVECATDPELTMDKLVAFIDAQENEEDPDLV